jgi:hypothetical protein
VISSTFCTRGFNNTKFQETLELKYVLPMSFRGAWPLDNLDRTGRSLGRRGESGRHLNTVGQNQIVTNESQVDLTRAEMYEETMTASSKRSTWIRGLLHRPKSKTKGAVDDDVAAPVKVQIQPLSSFGTCCVRRNSCDDATRRNSTGSNELS